MAKVTEEYLNGTYFEVKNNSHHTNWKVGATVKRVSDWTPKGFAQFTNAFADRHGGVCISAHMTEVGLAPEETTH